MKKREIENESRVKGARLAPVAGRRKAGATSTCQSVRVENLGKIGGADGVRTHDLLDAIEARSQLRHGPTGELQEQY